jgi:hypothetical protein
MHPSRIRNNYEQTLFCGAERQALATRSTCSLLLELPLILETTANSSSIFYCGIASEVLNEKPAAIMTLAEAETDC